MVSFQEYLDTCRFQDSPDADFVQDAQSDGRLAKAGSWEELRVTLLEQREASTEMIEAAQRVWQAYEQSQAKP
jgi:hypothetical protein